MQDIMHPHNKGFTLLELLVVISILAVLSAVTVVVLNPAELLRRSRDAQRLNDLAAITSAISFYMTETSSPDLDGPGTCSTTAFWVSVQSGMGTSGLTVTTTTAANVGLVNGGGWIKVDLASLNSGSPLPAFPVDPTNTAGGGSPSRFYAYACRTSPLGFQLVANLESASYKPKEGTDGGNAGALYETGTIAAYTASSSLGTLFVDTN
jgi:prepilin-type N-terminal cleavage/methylation domain-containing protein